MSCHTGHTDVLGRRLRVGDAVALVKDPAKTGKVVALGQDGRVSVAFGGASSPMDPASLEWVVSVRRRRESRP